MKYIPDILIQVLQLTMPRQRWYREYYLFSSHWKKFARKMRKNASEMCMYCHKPGRSLDVHHLNYDHLWNESFDDVIVLCRECHIEAHR